MKVTIIVAMTPDRVIGRQGELPLAIAGGFAQFKRITMGHPLIMGRKTFQSIGRPLPGRTSIVLSRDPEFHAAETIVVGSLNEAVDRAGSCPGGDEVFLVGGGDVYEQAVDRADRIMVTLVKTTVEGDAWFPTIDLDQWRMTSREIRLRDERNPYDLEFQEYRKALVDREPSSPMAPC